MIRLLVVRLGLGLVTLLAVSALIFICTQVLPEDVGANRSQVIMRHALPNAAAPIITVIALNLAYLLVGVVVLETVSVCLGIGQMADAVAKRDTPVIRAGGLVFAAAFVALNAFADFLTILVNPRLRHCVDGLAT